MEKFNLKSYNPLTLLYEHMYHVFELLIDWMLETP